MSHHLNPFLALSLPSLFFQCLPLSIYLSIDLSISLPLALLYWPRSFCSSFCFSLVTSPFLELFQSPFLEFGKQLFCYASFVWATAASSPVSNSKSENRMAWIFSWGNIGNIFPCFKLKMGKSKSMKNVLGKIGNMSPCFKLKIKIEYHEKFLGKNGQRFPQFQTQNQKIE